MKTHAKNVRELNVYKLAFQAAMEIFELSKKFPKEERYSLTDQVRRASRSVCSNLAESWHKRRYIAMFINKVTDCQTEAAETQTWLEFIFSCEYCKDEEYNQLREKYDHIMAQLITMEQRAELFCRTRSV
ncbi:MAG: four helix bundle protein [Bacteroidota bacterium]